MRRLIFARFAYAAIKSRIYRAAVASRKWSQIMLRLILSTVKKLCPNRTAEAYRDKPRDPEICHKNYVHIATIREQDYAKAISVEFHF